MPTLPISKQRLTLPSRPFGSRPQMRENPVIRAKAALLGTRLPYTATYKGLRPRPRKAILSPFPVSRAHSPTVAETALCRAAAFVPIPFKCYAVITRATPRPRLLKYLPTLRSRYSPSNSLSAYARNSCSAPSTRCHFAAPLPEHLLSPSDNAPWGGRFGSEQEPELKAKTQASTPGPVALSPGRPRLRSSDPAQEFHRMAPVQVGWHLLPTPVPERCLLPLRYGAGCGANLASARWSGSD